MSITLPAGYIQYGLSNDGNEYTAVKGDSVPGARTSLVVRRKPAVYNQGTKRFSVPQYELRVTRSLKEGDPALPIPEQELFSLTLREPVGHSADPGVAFSDFLAVINQPGFFDSAVKQLFPTEGTGV